MNVLFDAYMHIMHSDYILSAVSYILHIPNKSKSSLPVLYLH